ncbi:L,D-transpeptidase [Phytoactinopolyspora halotolerans]|uniref:L,D-transpeptidase family protein n=1 Tax=Phytoactinopolyspora halotolerans TaxID=1981512 RepID=A0A6L9SHK0_9ACTN|nr:L,D-transpeptidase [Phytoactinopolyspora halotolerans]NEE04118.1 L,D-transpeptidase family protein [Phytoactinopolyspora halotolerans]
MSGRYGASRHAPKRYPGRERARAPRLLRFVGVLLGASLFTGGVFALVSAGDAPGSRDVMSDDHAAPDADAAALIRDPDHISRSGGRDPGRRVHSLPRVVPERRDDVEEPRTPAPSSSPTADDDRPAATVRPERPTADPTSDPNVKPEVDPALPADSGEGRRIVYDITRQQVWLVEDGDEVVRTYPVSGSRDDELVPEGTYEVFSTSEDAISWDYESTMRYMVRFHRGENSNIGFHDIPVYDDSGKAAQTLAELGTPLSDGCVRQAPEDAEALWDFAPVGTEVVVVRT